MPRTNLIQLRGGTAAAWTSANPILALREMGVETDTRKFKFGDGTTAWNSLAYAGEAVGGTWGSITGTLSAQTDLQSALDAKQALVNPATALTDSGTIDLTAIKHTLATSSSRTFTISYTGDDISMLVTLNATSANQTFPATTLCVSEGIATGNNICPMAGVSGDKYAIAIKKFGSDYILVCKNVGQ